MDLQDLSLKEAAKVCGVSPQTVRRRRDRLESVGGIVSADGWHLTLDQLIAVGLTTKVRGDRETPPLHQRLEAAEARAALAEARAEKAEAVVTLQAQIIETQAQALRLIEASQTAPPVPAPEPEEPPAPVLEEKSRKGFWARLFSSE